MKDRSFLDCSNNSSINIFIKFNINKASKLNLLKYVRITDIHVVTSEPCYRVNNTSTADNKQNLPRFLLFLGIISLFFCDPNEIYDGLTIFRYIYGTPKGSRRWFVDIFSETENSLLMEKCASRLH